MIFLARLWLNLMKADVDPRQTEVKWRNGESSFFHEGDKETSEAGVHVHRDSLPAYLGSLSLSGPDYVLLLLSGIN